MLRRGGGLRWVYREHNRGDKIHIKKRDGGLVEASGALLYNTAHRMFQTFLPKSSLHRESLGGGRRTRLR